MEEIGKELEILGLDPAEAFAVKDVKKAYKKKATALLPEKNPDNLKAHSRFEDINEAFVKVYEEDIHLS